MPRKRKFAELTDLLQALPRDQACIGITFAELEQLGQGPLPPGAWTSAYWSNSTVARKNWLNCGFSAKLDRHRCTVLFSRNGTSPAALSGTAANGCAPGTQAVALGLATAPGR